MLSTTATAILGLVVVVVCLCPHFYNPTDAFGTPPSKYRYHRVVVPIRKQLLVMDSNSHKRHNAWRLRGFLDGLFGGDPETTKGDKATAVLATIDIPGSSTETTDANVRFQSLSDYIANKWIDLFATGTISLTTPVSVFKGIVVGADDDNDESLLDVVGCRLIFQKVDTGYQSKDEEDRSSSNNDDDENEKKEPKQGGVEILVQKRKPSTDTTAQAVSLRVVARRCEVDEDTMIKEMSEEIIVKELQKAIGVWKKESVF